MNITQNKSEITKELHWYLYGKDSVDTELVEIYDRLDHAAENLESDSFEAGEMEGKRKAEKELKELKDEIARLAKDVKILKKSELKEELERILF